MSDQMPRPVRQMQLVQLGDSAWGMLQVGLSAQIDYETNEIIVSIGMVAGKVSAVTGQLQAQEITMREVGRYPVDEQVAKLEAKEKAAPAQEKRIVLAKP